VAGVDSSTESFVIDMDNAVNASAPFFIISGSNGNVGLGTNKPSSKLYIQGGSANWNETTQGLSVGTIHLDPGVSTNNFGNAITFGASDSSNGTTAQAGIYVRSDSTYGTKMYFATTDSYADGSKTRMTINNAGNILIGGTSTTSTPSLDKGVYLQSQTDDDVIGYNLYVNETSHNRRACFFLNDDTGLYGFDATASTGVPDFVIQSENLSITKNMKIQLYPQYLMKMELRLKKKEPPLN
jgi:hypothetical protein